MTSIRIGEMLLTACGSVTQCGASHLNLSCAVACTTGCGRVHKLTDAMSEAIDNAAVMLCGVSQRYKESANVSLMSCVPCTAIIFDNHATHVVICAPSSCQCRLEANYAHQTKLDMIPLMMQENYSPNGWRKSQRQVWRLHFAMS